MASREIRICRRDAASEITTSDIGNSGSVGISMGAVPMQTRLWRQIKRMQAKLRPCRRDLGLAALYRRRSAILMLIRSIECYQRVSACQIQACPRRDPSAAA